MTSSQGSRDLDNPHGQALFSLNLYHSADFVPVRQEEAKEAEKPSLIEQRLISMCGESKPLLNVNGLAEWLLGPKQEASNSTAMYFSKSDCPGSTATDVTQVDT